LPRDRARGTAFGEHHQLRYAGNRLRVLCKRPARQPRRRSRSLGDVVHREDGVSAVATSVRCACRYRVGGPVRFVRVSWPRVFVVAPYRRAQLAQE
jgi:hypothetical protein